MKPSRETFAGRRRQPDMFGLERAALFPIAGAWTAAAMLMTLFHIRLGVSWPVAGVFTAGPALVVTLAALFLIQGKPRGYAADWAEEFLFGRKHEDFRPRKLPHPLHASRTRT